MLLSAICTKKRPIFMQIDSALSVVSWACTNVLNSLYYRNIKINRRLVFKLLLYAGKYLTVYGADILRWQTVEGKRFHILNAYFTFAAVVFSEPLGKSFVNVMFHHIYKHNMFPFAVKKRFRIVFYILSYSVGHVNRNTPILHIFKYSL